MCIFSLLFVFLFLSPPLQTLVPESERDGLISLVFVLLDLITQCGPETSLSINIFFLKSPTQTTPKFKRTKKRTRKFEIAKEKNDLDRDAKKYKMNKQCANQRSFYHYLLKTAEQSQSIYYQTLPTQSTVYIMQQAENSQADHHRDDLCTKPVHTYVHRYGQISHQITTLSCLWEEAGAARGNPRRIRGTDTRDTPTPRTTVSPHNFFFFFF